MVHRGSQLLRIWFRINDLFLTGVAWVLAYYLRFESHWIPVTKDAPDPIQCWETLPLVIVLAFTAYHWTGQYAIDRLRRLREEFVCVAQGVALLILLLIAGLFLTQDAYKSRATLGLFAGLALFGVLTFRRVTWSLIRRLRSRGYNTSFCIIAGVGRIARKTAVALRRASWMGFKNVGFVDDDPHPLYSDLDRLGTFEELPKLIDQYGVSHVFIALPMSRYQDVRRIFAILSQSLVDIRLVADAPALSGLSFTMSNLDGLPLVGLRESPHFGLNAFIKRVMDVVLSLVALVLLSPLLLVIAALIKLSSPGPVFYLQQRCGLNGTKFWMIKFRSLRVNAEAQTGAIWARKNDDRRTWFGAFLRKTSLDELPQIFNVLWGDMSLVGPRPERPEFIEKFRKSLPNYMARHVVKAGMTGWAQVHGWRGNTSLRKRLEHDLYYITHWTPWLDIRIMWLTLFRGFVHQNAY
jgi:Undecaprenyl-phosphate glucose phosphotransferase